MSAIYRLDWIDPVSGQRVAEITDQLELEYTRALNVPGVARFALNGNHPKLPRLSHRTIVEVWRKDVAAGLDWYRDFEGVFRSPEKEQSTGSVFRTACLGTMSKIGHRHVLYPAKRLNRSEFGTLPIETIMKRLVQYNLASGATTAQGRYIDGVDPKWSIMPDLGRGPVVPSFGCAGENVLEALQRLVRNTTVDFEVLRTGPLSWAFEVYPDGLGDDRTDSLVFSIGRNNVREIKYTYDRTNEKTVALVAGQGRESSRLWDVAYADGADEHIEIFIDANNLNTMAAIQARADEAIREFRAVEQVAFTVMQADRARYGQHYRLGTQATGLFEGRKIPLRIQSVTVRTAKDKPESIDVQAGTL